ncbi:hypothetical protein QBZ16_004345 [Prototheca wickerhamii]|uniref:SAP domain-containing protein n=1 Tax=Prototheca wickerhamii TaxID=3111 RepID=A0AAD9IHU0_PROWI|nr:hypothetical protein QBZ16_004345 [Prototheca wickerhamii]
MRLGWAHRLGLKTSGDKPQIQARLLVALQRRLGLPAPSRPELESLPEHLPTRELAACLVRVWAVDPPATRAQMLELLLCLLAEEEWEAPREATALQLEPMDWEELTMDELKDELRLRRLPVSGVKAKLVARLRDWHVQYGRAELVEGEGSEEEGDADKRGSSPTGDVKIALVIGGPSLEQREASLRTARWLALHHPRGCSRAAFAPIYVGDQSGGPASPCLPLLDKELFGMGATELDALLDAGIQAMAQRSHRPPWKTLRRPRILTRPCLILAASPAIPGRCLGTCGRWGGRQSLRSFAWIRAAGWALLRSKTCPSTRPWRPGSGRSGRTAPATARLAVRMERGGRVLGATVVSGAAAALLAAARLAEEHRAETDACDATFAVELVRERAVHFAVSVLGALSGAGGSDHDSPPPASAVALPVTELGYYDLMEDVMDAELALDRHRAICAGEDPEAATAVAAAVSRETRASPLYLGRRPVRDTQELRRFTPPADRGASTVLTPDVQRAIREAAVQLYSELGIGGQPAVFYGSLVLPEDEEEARGGVENGSAGTEAVDATPNSHHQPKQGNSPRRFEELQSLSEAATAPPMPRSPADPAALPPPRRVASLSEQRAPALTPHETAKRLEAYRAAVSGPSQAVYGEWGGTEIDDRTREQILGTRPPGVFATEDAESARRQDEEAWQRRQLPVVAVDEHERDSGVGSVLDPGVDHQDHPRLHLAWSGLVLDPCELLSGADSIVVQQATAAGLDWQQVVLGALLSESPAPELGGREPPRGVQVGDNGADLLLIEDNLESDASVTAEQSGISAKDRLDHAREVLIGTQSASSSLVEFSGQKMTPTAAVQMAERVRRFSDALPVAERVFLAEIRAKVQALEEGRDAPDLSFLQEREGESWLSSESEEASEPQDAALLAQREREEIWGPSGGWDLDGEGGSLVVEDEDRETLAHEFAHMGSTEVDGNRTPSQPPQRARSRLPRRPIWLLFGGEAAAGERTVRAASEAKAALDAMLAVDAAADIDHPTDAPAANAGDVRAFFLEPVNCGAQQDRRRARVLEYRLEMKKAGAEEEALLREAPTLMLSRLRDVPPSSRNPAQRGVWDLQGASATLGASNAELQHACEALARPASERDLRSGRQTTEREASIAVARQELELAGFCLFDRPRCFPWGALSARGSESGSIAPPPAPAWSAEVVAGDADAEAARRHDAAVRFLAQAPPLIPRDPLPAPRYDFLADWASEAAEAGAVVVPILGRDPVAFGPLQAAFRAERVPYALSSGPGVRRASDRTRLMRAVEGMARIGVTGSTCLSIHMRRLYMIASSERDSASLLATVKQHLHAEPGQAVCARLVAPRLESMAEAIPLASGEDLQLLARALAEGWESIDPGLLSAGFLVPEHAREGLRLPKVVERDTLVFEALAPARRRGLRAPPPGLCSPPARRGRARQRRARRGQTAARSSGRGPGTAGSVSSRPRSGAPAWASGAWAWPSPSSRRRRPPRASRAAPSGPRRWRTSSGSRGSTPRRRSSATAGTGRRSRTRMRSWKRRRAVMAWSPRPWAPTRPTEPLPRRPRRRDLCQPAGASWSPAPRRAACRPARPPWRPSGARRWLFGWASLAPAPSRPSSSAPQGSCAWRMSMRCRTCEARHRLCASPPPRPPLAARARPRCGRGSPGPRWKN